MAINAARYGILTQEYRWREAYSSSNNSRYVKAREIEIETDLDVSLISNLLTDMFGVLSAARSRFLLTLTGTNEFSIDSFIGVVPARFLTIPSLGITSLPVIVTNAVVNEEADTTTIEVWG